MSGDTTARRLGEEADVWYEHISTKMGIKNLICLSLTCKRLYYAQNPWKPTHHVNHKILGRGLHTLPPSVRHAVGTVRAHAAGWLISIPGMTKRRIQYLRMAICSLLPNAKNLVEPDYEPALLLPGINIVTQYADDMERKHATAAAEEEENDCCPQWEYLRIRSTRNMELLVGTRESVSEYGMAWPLDRLLRLKCAPMTCDGFVLLFAHHHRLAPALTHLKITGFWYDSGWTTAPPCVAFAHLTTLVLYFDHLPISVNICETIMHASHHTLASLQLLLMTTDRIIKTAPAVRRRGGPRIVMDRLAHVEISTWMFVPSHANTTTDPYLNDLFRTVTLPIDGLVILHYIVDCGTDRLVPYANCFIRQRPGFGDGAVVQLSKYDMVRH